MTISSTTNTVSYTGNGSTTAFAVPYAFFGTGTTSEIQVVEVVIATGAETVKSNGSDYTVAGGSGTTGTVTAATAPASTVKWVINRATTQTQETDYVENDPFPAESHEEALDRLTAIDQEQQRALDRTAQLPDGYTGAFDPTLPTDITGSTVLAFNAGATAFEVGPTTAAISGAAAEAAAAAVSADAAAASAADAATSYDNFDDRYLGQKSSDPSVDNDGDALLTGALYFNTTSNVMKVYTGSAWINAALVAADVLQVANNLSDLNNAVTARTNLGVAIGSDVQAYDADNAVTDAAQTFTVSQRGTITTDNDLSFDLSVTNNFACTPSGTGALTFTNHTSGQSGNILLVNSGGHAISLAATTKGDANLATTISTAGTYWLSYYDDGTNAYVVTSAVFA
jgi:hypothetical protein